MMLQCWAHDQEERISFVDAITFLRNRLKDLRGEPEDEGVCVCMGDERALGLKSLWRLFFRSHNLCKLAAYLDINQEEELIERTSTFDKFFSML